MSDGRPPSEAEELCFEAGIKFGTLYHQFAGTPVALESARELATAMESAIENQPYCESVTVDVREAELEAALAAGAADYVELTGRFLEVEIVVADGDREVLARMEMDDGYPLMRVVSVDDGTVDDGR
ncbi:dihydroneopterin aldolase family protein [Halopiger goleimassiliensis]|uniref:dihydroneopterin aldolase family protein n=1 Tax=Halopiger goleimassiliensis TaxID=1293048 RepID=UPI000678035F|nr:dihydroneopterin aldolase family protein [Halopiger goleimassiliensis]